MTEYAPEDQFIDDAVKEEDGPIPRRPQFDKPSATFLQKGINQFNQALFDKTGREYEELVEDGDFGLKTKQAAKDMILGLPPEMKRWANARLKKSLKGEAPIDMPAGMNADDTSAFLQNLDFENMDIG